jgi:hypothetical protein
MCRLHRIIGTPLVWGVEFLFATLVASGSLRADQNDGKERKRGEPLAGLAVSVAASHDKYSPGERISLDIACKNVSEDDINTWLASPLGTYSIEIVCDGKRVPVTPHGEKRFDAALSGSVSTNALHPGEQIGVRIHLNRLFDLSKPGKYLITAKKSRRSTGRVLKNDMATSNAIEVTIDDRPATRDEIQTDFDDWTFPKR